ncbi:MAG: hypothetical protein ACSHX7_05775 [Luteolibacter sp.]
MKSPSPPRALSKRGISLLELTVVILVLLSLVSILFLGTKAWRKGSDRATCIMKIRNMQVATRSYQNIYGYTPGGNPYASDGTQNIAKHLLSKGYISQEYFDNSQGTSTCPGGGTYNTPFPDFFPVAGTLYMVCSLASTSEHEPSSSTDW